MTHSLIAKLTGTSEGMAPYWSEITFAFRKTRNYHDADGMPWSEVIHRETAFWANEAKGTVGWKVERLSKRLRRVASRLNPSIPESEVANLLEILASYREEKANAADIFQAGMTYERRVSEPA